MTTISSIAPLSRRSLFRHGALLVGASALGGGLLLAAPAAAKVSQKGVSYQATPKGAARCDNCKSWQAPASCKVVDGVIAPTGWCTLYAK